MRIGIVTFFGPYGGALQCFALQQVLNSMGHDVYVVNRKWGALGVDNKRSFFSNCKQKFHDFLVKDPFAAFYEKKFKFTKEVISDKILYELGTKKYFDVIIAGSDQSWNPECINIMGYYFYLDWVSPEVKKYAYAVSFGKVNFEATSDEISTIKQILHTYNNISVREKSGIDTCKNIFDVDSQLCLDPTLLLTCQDYNSLIEDKHIPKDYICEFFLDRTTDKYNLVKEIAEKEGLSIIDNNPPIPNGKINRYFYKKRTISQWLRNIRYAKYVITDSFHGTVFSILYHKQFISLNNKNRGSARFENILTITNLIYRLKDIDGLDIDEIYSILTKEIDYSNVDSVLTKMKSESLSFLNKIK